MNKTTNNSTQFKQVLEERIRRTRQVLASKEREYAQDANRYHNFDVAGRIAGVTPERALLGMWWKHVVSVIDLVDGLGNQLIDPKLVDEKIGDTQLII